MKKTFLLSLVLLLVACSPSNETEESVVETKIEESSLETEGSETIAETIIETEEELTKEELILADIAKAEVEYYGLEKYYSRARIFNMLTSDEKTSQSFSKKIADYAIDKANIDFKKNALSTASIYAYDNWWSFEYIESVLKNDDLFTDEEVKYAMDNLDDVEY
nr:hypothetical protein [Helcococcus sueciensis]